MISKYLSKWAFYQNPNGIAQVGSDLCAILDTKADPDSDYILCSSIKNDMNRMKRRDEGKILEFDSPNKMLMKNFMSHEGS